MLKEIVKIMESEKIKGIGLMISDMGEKIRVTVSPVKKDGGAVPNFVVTDTVENLERDLPSLLQQYREVAAGNNLDELKKSETPKDKKKSDGKLKTAVKKAEEPSIEQPTEEKEFSLF